MIVLTTEEKDSLLILLEDFREKMLSEGLAVVPIEFKNGWMLPEEVLNDPRCAAFKKTFEDQFKVVIREVAKDELITSLTRPTE